MNLNYSKKDISAQIKAEALRLGFSASGIAPARIVEKEVQDYVSNWLHKGHHAGMNYMQNHFDKRIDPQALVEGTKSIISVALNYYPRKLLAEDQYQFAWYAYGKDYHDIMRQKLNSLFSFIHDNLIPVKGRIFCDTAPVLERYWAWRAGLGWIGKNTQLIIPQAGSCFFLGEIFVDAELDYDTPVKEQCGNCTNCLQNCPTQALVHPHELDANKCLSYLTIENKGEIPAGYVSKLGNKIYGCDECQKACPWNKFAVPCETTDLQPTDQFMGMDTAGWKCLQEEDFQKIFRGSAVKRARYNGLMRNINLIKD